MLVRMVKRPRSRVRNILLAVSCLAVLTACDPYAAAQVNAAPSLTPAPSPAVAPARDTCSPPVVGGAITVALATRADGSCARFDTAFVYRCDPAQPAVAVVDDGRGVKRFLGGSYAVPTNLPPQAFPIGVTGFGALYQDPSDPRFLWVQADGATTRWLALPARAKLGEPITAQMIGDSILDGGQTDVINGLEGWDVTVDAVVGRGSGDAAIAAETAAATGTPDVAVIEIGVNDHDATATAANAARVTTALGGSDVIVWLTAHGPQESEIPAVNAAIRTAMAPLPNGTVLDWDRLVPLDALSSDGVHPDTGQQGVLASILDPFLTTWRDAVVGEGPTACERTIRDAA